MNLHEELDLLARSSTVELDVDRVLGLARRRRVLVRVGVPVVLILLAVAGVVLPGSFAPHAVPGEHGRTHLTVFLIGADPAVAPTVRDALLARAYEAGLVDPAVTIVDSSTLDFSAAGQVFNRLLELAHRGQLQLRAVTAVRPATPGVPSATSGPTAVSLSELQAKLGTAYDVAAGLSTTQLVDAATRAKLEPFSALEPNEVELLPTQMQFLVPQISCHQLAGRSTAAAVEAQPMAVCNRDATMKYLLGPMRLTNVDIQKASVFATTNPTHYNIVMTFTAAGEGQLTQLTDPVGESKPAEIATVIDTTLLGVGPAAAQPAMHVGADADLGLTKDQVTDMVAVLNHPIAVRLASP